MNNYLVGDLIRIGGTFTTAAGVATDPGTVTVNYRHAFGTVVTWVYGGAGSVIRSGAGVYYADISPGSAGHWYYRFAGTGTGQSAGEGEFAVRDSSF